MSRRSCSRPPMPGRWSRRGRHLVASGESHDLRVGGANQTIGGEGTIVDLPLAHVTGPAVTLIELEQIGGKLTRFLYCLIELEEVSTSGSMSAGRSQRWNADREAVQAVEEIAAEDSLSMPSIDAIGRATMRASTRRGLSSPTRRARRSPHAVEPCAPDPDRRFRQEDGAAVGELEETGLLRRGAGERAAGVPEELGLVQFFRKRCTVDGDESIRRPAAQFLQSAREELLAGAGFAGDEHR